MITGRTIVAKLSVTVRGRRRVLRRAIVEPIGRANPRGGAYRVLNIDGSVVIARSRTLEVRWATPLVELLACRREVLAVPVRNAVTVSGGNGLWQAIADLAEARRIVAVDCSPRSEAIYIAPTGADLSEANRGPDGKYAGWIRYAWHASASHQRCCWVESANDLVGAIGGST